MTETIFEKKKSDVHLDFLVWFMCHPLTWRRRDLWPILQPATRYTRSRCFGSFWGAVSMSTVFTVIGGDALSIFIYSIWLYVTTLWNVGNSLKIWKRVHKGLKMSVKQPSHTWRFDSGTAQSPSRLSENAPQSLWVCEGGHWDWDRKTSGNCEWAILTDI